MKHEKYQLSEKFNNPYKTTNCQKSSIIHIKIIERSKIDITSTHIYMPTNSSLGTSTSIKVAGLK